MSPPTSTPFPKANVLSLFGRVAQRSRFTQEDQFRFPPPLNIKTNFIRFILICKSRLSTQRILFQRLTLSHAPEEGPSKVRQPALQSVFFRVSLPRRGWASLSRDGQHKLSWVGN